MATDIICLMEVDEKTKLKVEYNNNIYYFCSEHCLEKFMQNPRDFIRRYKGMLGEQDRMG